MAVRESKTIITAEDRASAVFKSFKNEIDGAASAMGKFAAAAAAFLLVEKFKSAFDSFVEGAAKLEEMSQVAGTTVEKLSSLNPILKLSGTSMDDFAKATGKLSKSLISSTEETKGAGKALAFLKISATDSNGQLKDSVSLTDEIAKKLATYKDGLAKTTIMQDIYGKSGAGLIPMMKDLAEFGLQNSKITQGQAELADQYRKDLVSLEMAHAQMGKTISAEVLPVADAFVKALLDMANKTNGLKSEVNKLAKDGSITGYAMVAVEALGFIVDAADGVMRVFQLLGASLGMQMAQIQNGFVNMANATGNFLRQNYGAVIDDMKSMAQGSAAITGAFKDNVQRILNEPLKGSAFVDVVREKLLAIDAALKSNTQNSKASADGYKNLASAQKDVKDAAQSMLDSLGKGNAKLQEEIDFMRKWGIETHETELAVAEFAVTKGAVSKLLADSTKYTVAEAAAMKEQILTLAKLKDSLTSQAESEKKYITEMKRLRDESGAVIQKIVDQIQAQKDQIATYNMSADAVTRYTISQLQSKLALAEATEGAEDNVRALQLQIQKLQELAGQQKTFEDLKNASSLWNEVADKGSKLFTDMLTSGKNAFSTLKDALKSFAKEMLAFFAKRYILQMAAGATGSGSLAAQAAGMDSGGGLVGSAVNGLGSLVGGTGIMSGIGSSLFGTAGTAGAGVLAESGTFATAGLLGTGGISATITSALAAIPVWGWIAIAALAAYAAFGGKGGGPKVEGSYMGNYGADGKLIDENPHRFFVGHAMDSASKQMSQGTAQTYAAYVSRFGGTAANTTFGFGSDSDPQGTAQNRVSGNAWVNGRQVFEQRDRNIGRDNSKIGEEMQLTAQRALIAALQATDMPGAIKKLFSGVDAYSITAAAATELLTKASAYADAFKALKDSLATIEAQMDGLSGNSIGALNTALKNLRGNVTTATAAFQAAMKGDDPMAQVSAEQALLNAVVTRYNTEMSMIQTLQDAIAQARDGVYQFGQAMAGRYANVGRNVDTSGASQQRVSELQQNIYGTQDPAKRIGFVNQALSAIDNWVTSSRAAVQRDFATKQVQMQADLQANQAIADARKKAIQTQIDGLNESIKLAGAFKSLAQQASQAITQMSQSGANPLSVQGRLGMAGDSVQALLSQFRGSSGQGRIDSANQLMQQLQGRMALGGEAFQRPSDAYQKIYNEVISTYAEIRDSALSESQQALAVQQQIADLTQQQLDIDKAMVAYQANQVDLTGQMNAALDAINAQAIAQYEQFDAIGRQAFAQQERNAEIQLNAITGGMNVALYTAQLQTQTRDLLVQIRDSLQTAGGPVTVTVVVTPPGPGDTGPGEPGPGGGRRTTINDKPLRDLVEDVVLQTVTQLRRELQRA